ncbi:beta-N-acetylhexosaminidase [Sphaerochaeta sp.]|uniref:beta-N-acetylhexosaminidase n=1 Tax=Sphaerochaeta sp. TaxID=1972642 RepID=UPI003FA6F162
MHAHPPLIPFPSQSFAWKSSWFPLPAMPLVFSAPEAWRTVLGAGVASLKLSVQWSSEAGNADVFFEKTASKRGPESYSLDVQSKQIHVTAQQPEGAFYALMTLSQLLKAYPQEIPCCSIEDAPAYPWRGFMLDVARNFFSIDELYRIVDLLCTFKMNVLHLHLSDDQGWRLEIASHPDLVCDPSRSYTQSQMRELQQYAAVRNVQIVPEIDLPGHTLALLSVYPQYSCTGGPFEIPVGEGIFQDILCVGKDEALQCAKGILREVSELFDSKFIHLGGDEIPLQRWAACPDCIRRRQDLGLSDEKDLLRWFCNEMAAYARTLGKHLILWNDYVDDGYDRSITTQIWNPLKATGQAARTSIKSDYFHTYLDMDHALVSLHTVYKYGRILRDASSLIGSELLLWTEYISTLDMLEGHLLPRLLAGAEIFWTQPDACSYKRFNKVLRENQALFIPRFSAFTPADLWDPPRWEQYYRRWKRKRRVLRNSREAGISL